MPDSAMLPRENYSIVVIGAMNPRIHHPAWYRTIGAIDEAEFQTSIMAGNIILTPLVAQFQLGTAPITVACHADRWEIQSHDDKSWQRMLQVTSLVFKKLNETPITIFAFNSQRHVDTDSTDVKSVLASILVDLDIGLPTGRSAGCNITNISADDDCSVTVTVQPSAISERAVFVAYNSQYQCPSAPLSYFDLGQLICPRASVGIC